MGSSPPHELRRSPTSGRSTYYPFPPPTMQPNSFVSGVTYAVDPPIKLANSTPPRSDSLSIQQSPPSASTQLRTLPPIHTLIEAIRPPELPLSLSDGQSSHTANPAAGLPSSRPHDPNSIIIQQSPPSAPSPWRQLPPLDFTRPGRLSPSILKSNFFGDPGLPLPRFYPSFVNRPIVSIIITSDNSIDMSDKQGHGLVGRITPGFRRMIVGYEGGHALDPQQQMYENPLMASEDRGHQASSRQQMYQSSQWMARRNNIHPADLRQCMHGNPESIAGAHSGQPSIAQQMQINTQLMARENRGHRASPQEHVRRLNPKIGQLDSSFRCDQCFEWHTDMASHRETHLEPRRFPCRFCKEMFTMDDLAASFSRPTKKTLINAFQTHITTNQCYNGEREDQPFFIV